MKKLLSVFVVALLVLAFAVPAFAFSDTNANSVSLLNGLGIVNGYPDGTFKPNANITRAEFAKIAVIAAGLKDTATSLVNTPSAFSDVKAGQWYTGWVNVAAAQGFVKGYPDGTFKPQADISYAEAITVLMRIIGYNDNLGGTWPVNYLAKAANKEVTKDVSFTSTASATRGDIAALTFNALKAKVVSWDKDKEKFVDENNNLLKENFNNDFYEDKLVTGYAVNNGEFSLSIPDVGSKKVLATAAVGNVNNITDLKDRVVDVAVNKDGKITFVGAKYTVEKSDKISFPGASASVEAKRVKINGNTYDFATGFTVPAALNKNTDADQYYPQIKVFINKDGYVDKMTVTTSVEDPAIVKEIKSDNDLITKALGDQTIPDFTNTNNKFVVFRDGVPAKMTDLKANDLIYVTNINGDYEIKAYSKTVTGTFESITKVGSDPDRVKQITIGGKKYDAITRWDNNAAVVISKDGGDKFSTTLSANDTTYFGKNVTALLDKNGDIAALIFSIEGTSDNSKYGVVVKSYYPVNTVDGDVYYVRVVGTDGKEVSYKVDKDDSDADAQGNTVYKLVKFTLTSSNVIDSYDVIVTTGTATAIDTDRDRVQIGSNWYIATNAVVFALDEDGDVIKTTAKAFMDAVKNGSVANVNYKEDKGKLEYVFVNDQLSSATEYALITDTGYNKDGQFFTLNIKGEVKTYNLTAGASTSSDLEKGDFVSYKLSGEKLSELTIVIDVDDPADYKVVEIDGNNILMEAISGGAQTWYTVDSDTVVYDAKDTDNLKYSGKDNLLGKKVKLSADSKNILEYVVVVE